MLGCTVESPASSPEGTFLSFNLQTVHGVACPMFIWYSDQGALRGGILHALSCRALSTEDLMLCYVGVGVQMQNHMPKHVLNIQPYNKLFRRVCF